MAETTAAEAIVHQDCTLNNFVLEDLRPKDETMNGHKYVDLGLSVMWATTNVGAKAPREYGDYYAWGEKKSNKGDYSWKTYSDANYKEVGLEEEISFTKYNNTSTGKTELELVDDVAHAEWGGTWRIPTPKEWNELLEKCTWTWGQVDGINCKKVQPKGVEDNGNYIFLPAGGKHNNKILQYENSLGYYWSNSLQETTDEQYAWYICLDKGEHKKYEDVRCLGFSVRPVCPAPVDATITLSIEGCDATKAYTCHVGQTITISADLQKDYCFVEWSDGVKENKRTIMVTGDLSLKAKIAKVSTDIESATDATSELEATKIFRNGQILILRDGRMYDLIGNELR